MTAPEEREAQATVATFDDSTGRGDVLLDDGLRLTFDRAAFAPSGLRGLRIGQRVRLRLTGSPERPVVTALTLVTIPFSG